MHQVTLRQALTSEKPLQVVGAINAYSALLAERAGFRAIYLSGAGVANASFGLPDLGLTTLSEVCEEVRRITGASDLPLLVDADTGLGTGPLAVARAIRELGRAGAAGVHLEDQVALKRCGHRAGKQLVTTAEMVERLTAAVDARASETLTVMARTDAYGLESLDGTIERAQRYVEAGADMIFAEAVSDLADLKKITAALDVPVLANMTEFGKTPMFTLEEFRSAGVALVLYPLSAFRAMSRAAAALYQALRQDGTQVAMLDQMQTREQLYEVLNYQAYEAWADKALEQAGEEPS